MRMSGLRPSDYRYIYHNVLAVCKPVANGISPLQPAENAKGVVAQAVHHIPLSVKIWAKAVDLEDDTAAKRKVLRKGLCASTSCIVDLIVVCSSREHPKFCEVMEGSH